MAASFFFYDLETSGIDPRYARIMQFAGQRTDLKLNPIGRPINLLVKLTPDVLPEPDAILLTGITPQNTLADGLTEAELLKVFYKEAVKPNTIFVGFNSVRFDDEFMRFINYRNFYDAFEWQWAKGNSRWDLLDVVRTFRALKPEGIIWAFAPDGKPTNRLEYLAEVNKLRKGDPHEALSDVNTSIAFAQLLRSKQPELFDYLLSIRKKDAARQVVESQKPFMYVSGRYPSKYLHASPTILLGRHAEQDYALVYDLRYDPTPFIDMSVDELIEAWRYTEDPDVTRLPVKTLKYNRCPAVIPGVVQDKPTLERLRLNLGEISSNLAKTKKCGKEFVDKLFTAVDRLDKEREQAQMALLDNQLTVDSRLYDGFINGQDKGVLQQVKLTKPDELNELADNFEDARLKNLLPLYKARNFPRSLSQTEKLHWEEHRQRQLSTEKIKRYFDRIEELADTKIGRQKKHLLEELRQYGQSIIPEREAD